LGAQAAGAHADRLYGAVLVDFDLLDVRLPNAVRPAGNLASVDAYPVTGLHLFIA